MLVETVAVVLVAVVLAGLVRTYVFQTFWIPSSSMVPTLGVYDRILVQKAFFSWHDVREGDIVVFSHPPLDDCPGPQNGRPGQARHRAARADDLLVRQQHLRERAPAGRALPAAATTRSDRRYRTRPGSTPTGCRPETSTCSATTGRSRATAGTGGRSPARASSARRSWCGGRTATLCSVGSDRLLVVGWRGFWGGRGSWWLIRGHRRLMCSAAAVLRVHDLGLRPFFPVVPAAESGMSCACSPPPGQSRTRDRGGDRGEVPGAAPAAGGAGPRPAGRVAG